MQVLTIPDLHGRTAWKDALEDPQHNSADKIVFLGDFVDSHHLSDEWIYSNFVEIIGFKESNPDKVILLVGNHDIQYLFYPNYRCSGFRPSMQRELSKLFQDKISCFQVAFQVRNNLWTHAGVSNAWLNIHRQLVTDYGLRNNNYSDTFNKILFSPHRDILHEVSVIRGGMYPYGGITWADLQETMPDPLTGMHQFVGHTPVHKPFKQELPESGSSITYLDCLQSVKKFSVVTL